mmetsp:Transcript_40792/g.115374  ORF Transcript_40792/g.115374 Transcript_40792/m.115374 type:complete len:128 (-) Transcript_40792:252-635(-)|eukprot:CAMPEP_0117684842 /NCGR_PEP_ID=MMETSP0804-20121206/21365_1 /TAXON_ID=1074897 /ORGANISM="Tetraselmis astigmatica, Strain CCMP880" /LENGTH=127 /DNA_ID=CAMNT_0005495961 /DNA_START=484 /DNA_END=867 /DNA_ORIENTATION=+
MGRALAICACRALESGEWQLWAVEGLLGDGGGRPAPSPTGHQSVADTVLRPGMETEADVVGQLPGLGGNSTSSFMRLPAGQVTGRFPGAQPCLSIVPPLTAIETAGEVPGRIGEFDPMPLSQDGLTA